MNNKVADNTVAEAVDNPNTKTPQLSDGPLCDVVDLASYVRRSEILACLTVMCHHTNWYEFIQDLHDHSVDAYNDGDLGLALAKAEVAVTAYMLQLTLPRSKADRLCEKHLTEQLEKEREILLSLNKLKVVNMIEANCSDDEIKSVNLIEVAEYSKASQVEQTLTEFGQQSIFGQISLYEFGRLSIFGQDWQIIYR